MNKDQVGGKIDQTVGKVKQKVGETVGNQHLANEGVADRAKGAVRETWGNVKDDANKTAEAHKANAMAKMGMKSRIDIVRYALLNNWLEIGDSQM